MSGIGADDLYRPLDEAVLPGWLARTVPASHDILGGRPEEWRVREVGDGNLNLVFVVTGTRGGVVVKQALPYVRLVGESWPLPLDRAFFEHEALVEQGRHVDDLVPRIHHFDRTMAYMVMEHLSPHVILRKSLIQGVRHPRLARDLAEFLAQTLFKTSDFHLGAAEKKRRMAVFCDNTELCRITEDLVFTDPYRDAELNRWTRPHLDDLAVAFRQDHELKLAVQALKHKFLTQAQALIHGDLHTGSIMVTEHETRVIDPEFAFYGPMGFDIGAVIGNLLLAYFAQDGHGHEEDPRTDYQTWILDQIPALWDGFATRFLDLWADHDRGDVLGAGLFPDADGRAALDAARRAFMDDLFRDSLGFAGAKMIRRILGLAHVADLESIEPPALRAACERRALAMGRRLVVNGARFSGPAEVCDQAREIRERRES